MPSDQLESALRQTPPGPQLKWGILGAARIAHNAMIPSLREVGAPILAVGASTLGRAESFARDNEIPQAFEGYQPVLDLDEVDAVYVPLANGLHYHWALAAARAGKHCLCEKPLVLEVGEALELRQAFEQAGVRLVESFMWRLHPQTDWILNQVRHGEIGHLRRIHAEFSFMLNNPEDYRWRDDQGGGAFWDVGCYCVNAARLFFGAEPATVSAAAAIAPGATSADRSAVGWLDFGNDRLATFACSFTSAHRQQLSLIGTEGSIEIEHPFIGLGDRPTAVRVRDAQGLPRHEKIFEPANAFVHLIQHFTRAARDSHLALWPAEDGGEQTRAMTAVARSIQSGAAITIE